MSIKEEVIRIVNDHTVLSIGLSRIKAKLSSCVNDEELLRVLGELEKEGKIAVQDGRWAGLPRSASNIRR